MVFTDEVKIVREGPKNVLILRNLRIAQMRNEISYKIRSNAIEENKILDADNFDMSSIYGLKFKNRWSRVVLKFRRQTDNLPVFVFMDDSKLLDWTPKLTIHKLTDPFLLNLPAAEFKFVIYGIGSFGQDDDEYRSIFEQMKDITYTAVYGLVEEKSSKALECFAGDLLYEINKKTRSFREILIGAHITYPSKARGSELNRKIFRKRAQFLCPKVVFVDDVQPMSSQANAQEFTLDEILGEGSVSYFF